MVQVLIWNGEDRPPIITVDGAFSNGNPTVGDTLVVRRAGSAVGTITLKRIQFAERRAFFEVLTGQMPEAGDVLRWNGNSDANVESVSQMPARRGDIADLIDDGRHPGLKVVTTPNWNDPVDYSTQLGRGLTAAERTAGQWPDFVIVDIPGPTAEQGWVTLANRASAIFGYPGTPRRMPEVLRKCLNLDYAATPQAFRNGLRDDGRWTITGSGQNTAANFMSYLQLKRGINRAEVERRLTFDGNRPDELTTYL